jgi:hypothetical protein
VEVLDQDGKHLGLLPRSYTVKTQPIDWKGYFAIFVRKPRGACHTAMYHFLPSAVRNFLERGEAAGYRERLKFIFALLQEGQSIETIARAICEANSYDPALIRHQLYRVQTTGAAPEVAKCYERKSIIITSNIQFGEWNRVLGDNRLTAALIDRLVHHAHILAFSGESYRLKKALATLETANARATAELSET